MMAVPSKAIAKAYVDYFFFIKNVAKELFLSLVEDPSS